MHTLLNHFTIYFLLSLNTFACTRQEDNKEISANKIMEINTDSLKQAGLETATFGAGCFWCVEAIFQELDGVEKVASGYSGGNRPNPTYEQVCSGATGYAEVIQVYYDPKKITYDELLDVFWRTHDPTTPNQQGADRGTQYRSAIFYHDDKQKELAEKYKKELDASGAFDKPIVTEIAPFRNFYLAESYHQNYYKANPDKPYCSVVIQPKLEKFRKVFKDKLKD